MGLIARQSIKGTIYSYIGAVMGFVNIALLMPQIFSTHQVGLVNILISMSIIIGQLGTFGFVNVTTRLFPFFRSNEKKHNGFALILLLVAMSGCLFCLGIYFLINDVIITQNIEKSPLLSKYVYLLLPLVFFFIFQSLLEAYNRVLFNASFGIFVREFLLRILNFGGIGMFYFNILNFEQFIHYYVLAYSLPTVLLTALLIYRKQFSLKPSFEFINKKLLREMVSVGIFGLLAGFSSIAAMHIDRYMLNYFNDLSATGVYAIAFYFGTIILLPGRSVINISSIFITEAFKENDLATVYNIYRKSALNMFIIGMGVFLLLWGNIDTILWLLPSAYETGKWVIFFISLSYLIIMGSGMSSEIILYSQYYRYYALIMITLIILIVIFNLLFIPKFGLTGAAVASLVSYFIYTCIKYVFVLAKFKMQPFSLKHLVVLLIGLTTYGLAYLLPEFDIQILNLIVKSFVICLFFITPVYFFGLSEDINKIINTLFSLLKSFRKS